MATGKMYDCETKRPHRNSTGGTDLRWVPRSVAQIPDGSEVRCLHCHGRVRIYRQRVANGPRDHVEHLSGDDARHCLGGGEFKADGVHRMSPTPVT
jgi:hypothetical protein